MSRSFLDLIKDENDENDKWGTGGVTVNPPLLLCCGNCRVLLSTYRYGYPAVYNKSALECLGKPGGVTKWVICLCTWKTMPDLRVSSTCHTSSSDVIVSYHT
jgi:hypothetical protein